MQRIRLFARTYGFDVLIVIAALESERSWQIAAPVLDASGSVHSYAAGTWGPGAADEPIAPRTWRTA